MTAPRALFIGGNGIISAAASRLAIERGFDLTLLNRGTSSTRPPIPGARTVVGDAGDPSSIAAAVGSDEFDVVVSFQTFVPADAEAGIRLFRDRTAQFVFISSAAAYQKPVQALPIRESTPLVNPFWKYARDKAASEDVFVRAFRDTGFPVTIVRPSHTYDPSLIPMDGGWTVLQRMLDGKETVILGDGTSLWTLTHHTDFAKGLVGLLGNPRTIGDVFQITSDEALTWDQIARMLGAALGTEPKLVHVASELVARAFPEWAEGTLGDRMHSVVFDNTKVKSLVPDFVATTPFWRGAQEIVEWHMADPSRRLVDADVNARLDALVAAHG